MPNLERRITQWRATMMAAPEVSPKTLDELENHLREHIDQLLRSGMPEPEAFQSAVARLGDPRAIASEFQKLDQSTWLPVKVITGLGVVAALALAILLIPRLGSSRSGFLLGSHVFLITLGYLSTLLLGVLGICFVSQRSLSDFPQSRLRSLPRLTAIFGSAAVVLTALGVVQGMLWAKAEWGRYWAWDVKETGGFAVLVWQTCFLCAHRWARGSARGLLVFTLLGNLVVGWSWFGANLLSGTHSYGTFSSWLLLLLAGLVHVAFFVMGLAPAGWLRPRRNY